VLPEAELRVVDPVTGRDVGPGGLGELWFRTPQLMRGFLHRPAETAEVVVEDGWFRTGDMGRVDDGGYVYVQDRLKDMIISGGENIYSPEVERVLAEHPAVAEVAVVGVPDEQWGEVVKAFVALRPGSSAEPEELVAFCRGQLAGFKTPRSVEVVEALPRNPTGKILKRDLRAPYWQGRERSVV
jgi:acyl-CoA synthetase (AMP-forming)/AMP-acid ligase II